MWIADGEKYALIGLDVALEGPPPPEQVAPNLWALTETTLDVPSEWRTWLGAIRANQVAGCNLFLVRKLLSATPEALDDENRSLKRSVNHFYLGLLLSAMFSPSHKPVMLTGAGKDGMVEIRQQTDLELPAPQVFDPYPPVRANDIQSAAHFAQRLDAMGLAAVPGGLWRILRTLTVYIETRAITELVDRIHQYCRCIDGLILPAAGKTKRQFKSRTELFIGPGHHDLMGALYDIQSDVEHLHEDRYLETFDREVRLDLVKKEAVVENIARKSLARIIGQEALWPHFGNTAALGRFWALPLRERRAIWGDAIDPMVSLAGFDPQYLHDGHLR